MRIVQIKTGARDSVIAYSPEGMLSLCWQLSNNGKRFINFEDADLGDSKLPGEYKDLWSLFRATGSRVINIGKYGLVFSHRIYLVRLP